MYQAFIWIYFSVSRFSAKSVGKHCFKSAKYQNEVYHKCLTFHTDFEQVFAAYVSTHLLFCTRSIISTLVTPNILGYYFSSAHNPRAPALGPIYFCTAPCPNYFFAAPMYQNYFFTAPNDQNYYFTALVVENVSCISVLSKCQTFQLKEDKICN